MRYCSGGLVVALGASLLVGCVVREERPRRRVVIEESPPPAQVEVVPAQPGPEYVYVQGVYVREGDHWNWHHGYWRR